MKQSMDPILSFYVMGIIIHTLYSDFQLLNVLQNVTLAFLYSVEPP